MKTTQKGEEEMTQSQNQRERQWRQRKEQQNPHGKVKSLDQLAEETTKRHK